MADEVTTEEEPTNEQLANFLMVYAPKFVGQFKFENLDVGILKGILDSDPRYRAGALRHHKAFVKEATAQFEKMARGQLRCAFVRPNGKRCVNWNEPGSFYCGIESHQPPEEENGDDGGSATAD